MAGWGNKGEGEYAICMMSSLTTTTRILRGGGGTGERRGRVNRLFA